MGKMEQISKIKLDGVKTFENRASLYSSCMEGVDLLGRLCSVLAAERMNMGMLTHVADNGSGESVTTAGAKSVHHFSRFLLDAAKWDECTRKITGDACSISIFTHDQRPGLTASLIAILGAGAIKPYVIGTSPSAVTVVVSSSDFGAAMQSIFDCFALPSRASFEDWRAACRMDDRDSGEVKFLYDKQIIGIYGFTRQTGLDLWNVSLPVEQMANFGAFLLELDKLDFKLPFLISSSACGERDNHFSFVLAGDRRETAKQAFDKNLPGIGYLCRGPVFSLFAHGPHFGDRYGIADALASCVSKGNIPLLALSCTVASISAICDGDDPDRAIEVLSTRFQIPAGVRRL